MNFFERLFKRPLPQETQLSRPSHFIVIEKIEKESLVSRQLNIGDLLTLVDDPTATIKVVICEPDCLDIIYTQRGLDGSIIQYLKAQWRPASQEIGIIMDRVSLPGVQYLVSALQSDQLTLQWKDPSA